MLGILSLVFWLTPIIGLPIEVTGLILGIVGVKGRRKYAMAALICSIIGLVLAVANAAVGAYIGAMGQHALVTQMLN